MIVDSRYRHELSGIEVLRFICAVCILIYHYQDFFFTGQLSENVSRQLSPSYPLYAMLAPVYEYGWWAVYVFWTISGFIFYSHYSRRISTRGVGASEFAVRRFSRLYPLHIATLCLVVLGQYVYATSHHGESFIFQSSSVTQFLSQLPLASNWFSKQPSFNGPIWSVSVEILIYFAFFYAIRVLGPGLIIAASLALAAATLYTLHQHGRLQVPFINPAVYACAAYFFAGGVIERMSKQPLAFPIAICTLAGIIGLLALGLVAPNNKAIMVLALSATVVFACAGTGAGIAGPPLRRLAFLGNATYSSYLMHFPLQIAIVLVVDALGYDRSLFFAPLPLFAYLALVIACSLAVYRWFERPMQERIRVLASVR